jgi:hypothetical protein
VASALTVGVRSSDTATAAGELRQLTMTIRTAGGAPAVGATVRWRTPSGDASGTAAALTGEDGNVFFSVIPVGPVLLSAINESRPMVYRPGRASLTSITNWQIDVPSSGALTVSFPEPRMATARVAVLTPDGRPVPGAGVYVGRTNRLDSDRTPPGGPILNEIMWSIQSRACFENPECVGQDPLFVLNTDLNGTVEFPYFLDSALESCRPPSYAFDDYCERFLLAGVLKDDIRVNFTDGQIVQNPTARLNPGGDTVVELPFMPQLTVDTPAVIVVEAGGAAEISVSGRDGAGNALSSTVVSASPVGENRTSDGGSNSAALTASAKCLSDLESALDKKGQATLRVCATSTGLWEIDAPSVLGTQPVCIRVGGSEASGFEPLTPARIADTRLTERALGATLKKKVGDGYELRLRVLGLAGVPNCEPVAGVAMNVAVTQPEGPGFVTVYPCGDRPVAANLNYLEGQTIPNSVIAPLSEQGEVCFFSLVPTHLVADVSGWFPSGGDFVPLVPGRLFDSRPAERDGLVAVSKLKVGGSSVLRVKVAGAGAIPATGVGAVAMNVAVTQPEGPGFVTVYPCGDRPVAANLNYLEGQTIPNSVIAPLSEQGEVCFFSLVPTHLVADVSGWFPGR